MLDNTLAYTEIIMAFSHLSIALAVSKRNRPFTFKKNGFEIHNTQFGRKKSEIYNSSY